MPDGSENPLFGVSLRQPPANLQAEMALLGAILANNKAFDRVADFLVAEHFADPVHQRIYQAIGKRVAGGGLADAVTLGAELATVLEPVGGHAYLGQLLTANVGLATREYGQAIRDAWVRRQVIDIGAEVVDEAFLADPDRNGDTLITEAVERLLQLGEMANQGGTGMSFGDAVRRALERAEAAQAGRMGEAGLETGLASVDRLWGGLWPGQLYFLAARSRTGKTSFALQAAKHVAGQLLAQHEATGEPLEHVHFISLEMTGEDVGTVSLSASSGWTSDEIRAGRMAKRGDDDPWWVLAQHRDRLARLPILVDDHADMTIGQLMTRARIVKRTKRTRLLIIDYMEVIGRGRDYARMGLPEWIPTLGYRLKALAKILGVPIIVLRQINKSVDKQEVQRPTLGDLPYDGGQAADAVFALHRPELYLAPVPPVVKGGGGLKGQERQAESDAAFHKEAERVAGLAEFGALKRRFGACGWRDLRFHGPTVTFSEIVKPAAADEPPQMSWEGF